MNIFSGFFTFFRVMRWRLTWNRRNTHYRFVIRGNPKFMGPRDAVQLIQDGDVCMIAGLAGNQRVAIMNFAIREVYEETDHPQDLTIISPGGQGGRGIAPGTVEELGVVGLVQRFFSGHHETYKSLLDLAEMEELQIQCIPQGVLALLVDAQARGEQFLETTTGVGTFCDPRVGTGSSVLDPKGEAFIEAAEDKLRYHLPKINVAIFNVPAADPQGNLYIENCATFCEAREAALAAKKNGGKVIANVGILRDKKEEDIFLAAENVDAIVLYPDTEQTVTFRHRFYSRYFTSPDVDAKEGISMVRLVNFLFGITPRRGKVEKALARLGALYISKQIKHGSYMNIGTGLPEEICYCLHEQDWIKNITMFTEAGAIGGIPAPGIFFGSAIAPKKIISSPEIFKRAYKHLDATTLGFLQADSLGNVNASKRGEGAHGFVGPGGFIDFTSAAKNIFFVGSWMTRGKFSLSGNKLNITKYGKAKFVEKVDQITFCGQEALKAGKNVFFITTVGIFQLTEKGMELIEVMPGIDIKRDIQEFTKMKVVLPESGEVPVVDSCVITGKGFEIF